MFVLIYDFHIPFGSPESRYVDKIASRAFNSILNQISPGISQSTDLTEIQSTMLLDCISQILISIKLDNEPSIKSFLLSLLDIYESGTKGSRRWAVQKEKLSSLLMKKKSGSNFCNLFLMHLKYFHISFLEVNQQPCVIISGLITGIHTGGSGEVVSVRNIKYYT